MSVAYAAMHTGRYRSIFFFIRGKTAAVARKLQRLSIARNASIFEKNSKLANRSLRDSHFYMPLLAHPNCVE